MLGLSSGVFKGEAIVSTIAVDRHLPPSGQERPSQLQLIRTKLEWGPFPQLGVELAISVTAVGWRLPQSGGGESAVSATAVDWRLPPLGQE